jgi:hypothetical protein
MAKPHKEKGVSSTFLSLDHVEAVEILGFYSISLAGMLAVLFDTLDYVQ